ncbi:MAG TPA: demethoxyubiquinone hydroxylase family protein [Rhizomicrobium sp.]|nr:demethoxyubiquinone hydroxylase family protein [Rhizomicrobium sp.]
MIETDQVIRRILRVDHAGEHGAVAIYSAQIARAPAGKNDLLAWLQETLGHEQRHRDAFRAAMPSRAAKPCRALAVWSVGGRWLGRVSALFGTLGIMVCTAAVERTVHRHLVEQIAFLRRHDGELADIVCSILSEEKEHLAFAEANHNDNGCFARLFSWMVSLTTELMILISTRGDSFRLKAVLRKASS